VFADRLADVIETRARRPELVAEAAARRSRAPSFLRPGGTLVLIAADHPARGTLRAGRLMTAMADRTSLLERLCVALARPGVDGVLGSADVLEDLLPALLLGGEVPDDPESALAGWRKALRLPNVKGLVAGRSLLYPADDDVAAAVDTAASLL
jgi:hypothetical protein